MTSRLLQARSCAPSAALLGLVAASCGLAPSPELSSPPAGAPLAPPWGTASLVATEEAEVSALDAAPSDIFGYATAISGDTALVGAPYEDEGGTDAGSAYVFVRANGAWTQTQKLVASDAASSKWFGYAVAISGDTAVVGSPNGDGKIPNSGVAYVFVRVNGVFLEKQKLIADDGKQGDAMGTSAALIGGISGGTVIVGAPREDSKGPDAGAAYTFVSTGAGFSLGKKLFAADTEAGDQLGTSVAMDGVTAVVGAPGEDEAGNNAGAAYVFVRTGGLWSQQKKLMAGGAGSGDAFGAASSVLGDEVIIGAPTANAAGSDSGAAFTFARAGILWSQTGKLAPQGLKADTRFGGSVALGTKAAVVGASLDDTKVPSGGAAYIFTRQSGTFVEDAVLLANDATTGDAFGASVALSGDTAIVGAYLDDDAGTNAGSAYLFLLKSELGEPCVAPGECETGFCVDGVCCDTACAAGACDSCASGTCTLLEGAPCDDGDACTQGDSCVSGQCTSGAPLECPGGSCVGGQCIIEMDAGTDAEADADADADAEADAGADAEADAGTDAEADPDGVRLAGGGCSCQTTPAAPSPSLALFLLGLVTSLSRGYRRPRASSRLPDRTSRAAGSPASARAPRDL